MSSSRHTSATANAPAVDPGRRLKLLGQGAPTQGHLRLFTHRAVLDLLARERFTLEQVVPVSVWSLPGDHLLARLSPTLAADNTYLASAPSHLSTDTTYSAGMLGRVRRLRRPTPEAASEPGDADLPVDREGLDNHSLTLLMAARLDTDSTFVDVGANEGRFLYAARNLAPAGRHIAVEPLPDMAGVLRERFPEVSVHNVAMSDTSGTADFVRVIEDSGYSGLKERPYPGPYRTERIEVEVARLDDIISEDVVPAFVKLDVEGAEVPVLRGGVETLRRSRPWLAIEHGPEASDAFDATSQELWDIVCGALGLRVFDMDGRGPLDRDTFVRIARSGTRWNWFARP